MKTVRYIWATAGCVLTTLWLAGCGGNGTATSSLSAPNNPNNSPFPSTNRNRLYQHGDEFIYTVTGVAWYRGQRWEVSGTVTDRFTSVGAGVMRLHRVSQLTLRRGSETLTHNRQTVFYGSQDRQSREATLIGYADDENAPLISCNLPYKVAIPGILNENSNFSFSTMFEDGTAYTETWQIGTIEPVETYAGKYYSYRMRVESQWDEPAPFVDTVCADTRWFSPQLGWWTRIERLESTWRESDPIEYRLTYILYRTNVSLQPSNP